MPFRFRWPFSWSRRRAAPKDTSGAAAPATPIANDASAAPSGEPGGAAVQRVLAAAPPASPVTPEPAPTASAPDLAPTDGPDLGAELLGRLPSFALPPTLGRLGGLPAMAQTLPTVERFFQNLPTPPAPSRLPGLGETGEFAASLPSLVGFAAPTAADQTPAFPAQLEAPAEPTDVLAPFGGLPGQIAGLTGAAPVLTPERPTPALPTVVPSAVPQPTTVTPDTAVPAQRAASAEARMATAPVAAVPPSLSTVVTPLAPPAARWPPAWPMTQVLPLAQTLTGNVLPGLEPAGAAAEPVQRELKLTAPAEWPTPEEFVRPGEAAGERLTPAQRESIESQRGQGRPLEPEIRERFEQAYGQPLDNVRVHTGPTAHAAAESLNSIAFASGPDLFFTQSSYTPDNPQGLSLIGHELAHVIQQQYGIPGDADALRPPDDRYEQQADQLASRALATPLARPSRSEPSEPPGASTASVQRVQTEDLRRPGSPPTLPAASTWTPGEQLSAAAYAAPQTLASPLVPGGQLPEDEPVERFSAGQSRPAPPLPSGVVTAPAPNTAPSLANLVASPAVAVTSAAVPSLERAPWRLGSLTEQLLSPVTMLSPSAGLSESLPGLGLVQEAGQTLPVFRSMRLGLPGMSSLPGLASGAQDRVQSPLPDTGGVADQMPTASSLPALPGLGGGAPAMPDLGSVAQSLGGGSLPALPSLPSLGGLKPPAMPLAEGLGGLGQAASEAASGALATGQQAVGAITSAGPGDADTPAAPPLPSLDKLTEHVWKEIQRKLKVERERSRGLA